MQAIEDKILNKMKKCGRGKLYSASDFAVYGSAVSVAKALERLTRKGGLVRIARGLYCLHLLICLFIVANLYKFIDKTNSTPTRSRHPVLYPCRYRGNGRTPGCRPYARTSLPRSQGLSRFYKHSR